MHPSIIMQGQTRLSPDTSTMGGPAHVTSQDHLGAHPPSALQMPPARRGLPSPCSLQWEPSSHWPWCWCSYGAGPLLDRSWCRNEPTASLEEPHRVGGGSCNNSKEIGLETAARACREPCWRGLVKLACFLSTGCGEMERELFCSHAFYGHPVSTHLPILGWGVVVL